MSTLLANLLDFDYESMRLFFEKIGEKPYRAQQMLRWIHQRGVKNIQLMDNLKKSLRSRLASIAEISLPEIVSEYSSKDGTKKWLLRLKDGNCIETVFIPEKNRKTVCVSSQVGCVLNCSFCSTGRQGFSRNLHVSEIIGQVWIVARDLEKTNPTQNSKLSNIVLMGMGEPLLNFENVVKAMNLMMDDFAYGLSKRRVTLSTSGLVPALKRLSEVSEVSLAVSLHAPNDALRNILVPINKKYPLNSLINVCRDYFKGKTRRSITMEYVMLKEINDQPEHARQLIKLLEGVPVKINLIPFNPFPHAVYTCSSASVIDDFKKFLNKAGFNVIIRKTRGEDINAACGQLVGQVKGRTFSGRKHVIPLSPQICCN